MKGNALSAIFNFVKANWRLLLVLFAFGGTATVLSVVPGMEGTEKVVQTQIDNTKLKLVSPTIQ